MESRSPCPFSLSREPNEGAKPHQEHGSRLKKQHTFQEFTLVEVKKHNTKEDAWIAVGGKVYDITDHILNHPGWDSAAITTVLSILAHIGSDCTQEFIDIHRSYPVAWNQLNAYYIGQLADSP